MSANELRIGNLVWFRDKKIVEVSNLGNSFETVELVNGLRYGSDDIDEYNPVELSEEWLLKFGFENHSTNKFWFRKKQICISIVGVVELISCDMQALKIDLKIEYVHQLQNLYFALTGEELKQIEL